MPFEIVRNDITTMQTDAIVNTANPNPVIDTGVDSGIHKKAGHKLLEADCHSDRAGKSGRQGACGDFDARGVAVLGMAGGLAAKLAELLQTLDGDIVSEEVQQRIEEHRTMAGGEHEPVAANPVRTLRVEAEEL